MRKSSYFLVIALTAACGSGAVGGDGAQLGGDGPRGADGHATPDATPEGSLPAKVVGGYWQMWQGPTVAEITAQAPEYNVQYAAFALGTEAGTGRVSFDPVFEDADALKTDIAASRAAGSRWLISVGGGGEGTIRLTSSEHAAQMVETLIPIIDDYGFDGLDFDLESGPEGWSVEAAAEVANALVTHYGDNFIVSAAPRPYEDEYRDLAVRLGPTLDLFGLQFYDAPEFNDAAFLRENVTYRVNQAIELGIPASAILIGCITHPDYAYGHNTVDVYRDIFLELEVAHPELRGVFVWETSLDKDDGWRFARGMGAALLGR